MNLIKTALLLVIVWFSVLSTSAYTISLSEVELSLAKVEAQKLGIAVWDQRSQVVDGTQSAGLVGYTRRVTYAAFPVTTESNEALATVLAKKIQTAQKTNDLDCQIINTAASISWEEIKERMSASDCDKFLVLKISKLEFDGIKKYEFKLAMDIEIYDASVSLIQTSRFSEIIEEKKSHMNANDYKKKMPPILKGLMEQALNDEAVVTGFSKTSQVVIKNQRNIQSDLIITKKGEEIEAKVEEITSVTIKYRKTTQPDGPIRNVPISEVFMIKYGDGSKELFD